jgi:hypothetical protein
MNNCTDYYFNQIGFTAKETGDSNIYIYNLKILSWVKSYQPATSESPGPASSSSASTTASSSSPTATSTAPPEVTSPPTSTPSPGATAGATIGSIAGAAAVGALVFVFYKRRKDHRETTDSSSKYGKHDPSIAPSSSSENDTTPPPPPPPQNRFSMLFSSRDTMESQRYSWHPGQDSRPSTMVSSYSRYNRASVLSHPSATYNHQRYSLNNISNLFETPEDLRGVDVGNSYFMPKRELFVVNADSDSNKSVTLK